MSEIKEFLVYLLSKLVEKKDQLSVEESTDQFGVLFLIKVAPEDMGKIIGRLGNVSNAMRVLVRAVAFRKYNLSVSLKILEPEGSTRPERPRRTEAEVDTSNGYRSDKEMLEQG